MGFSFKKSIKLGGGFRLNLSSKGIGLSGGVKGARLSVGPSGVRAYGGAGPLRFQKSLSSGRRNSRKTQRQAPAALTPAIFVRPAPTGEAWLIAIGLLLTLVGPYAAVIALFGIISFAFRRKCAAWRSHLRVTKIRDSTERAAELVRICSLYPHPFYKFETAKALLAAGQAAESVPYWEFVAVDFPQPEYVFAYCEALYESAMFDDAITHLSKIDEKDESEDFLDSLLLKAECWIAKKEYDRAVEVLKKVLASRGEDSIDAKRTARLMRAKVNASTGRAKEAIKELIQVTADAPNFAEAANLLEELRKKESRGDAA